MLTKANTYKKILQNDKRYKIIPTASKTEAKIVLDQTWCSKANCADRIWPSAFTKKNESQILGKKKKKKKILGKTQ